MNHSGQLPPGQGGYTGQPQQQQHQQFAGYQQGHPQQQQHFQQQQARQHYGFPSQELGSFGYNAGFGEVAQPQHHLQAQNQWAYYNADNGYGGGNGGMQQMPAQEQYMAPQAGWQQQQTHAPQAPRPQQQSYHMPSPQMQHAMNAQAHYGNQDQTHFQQGQQMSHLQQAPRRSPSMSQQHQQIRQRPSPQVHHQPSPHVQRQPSPQSQQQHFALNNAMQQQQQQQSYQQIQPQQQGQRGQMQGPPHQQQQQTRHPSPRVPSQQPQTNTPPLQPRQPQILQPQARLQQPQPQPQPQVAVMPKPESTLTSFQGPSQPQEQARPQVPAPNSNQTRQVPSPQEPPQSLAGDQVSIPPTTAPQDLQYQQLHQKPTPAEDQVQFVNLQDIQAAAPPKLPSAASTFQTFDSLNQAWLQSPAPVKKAKSPSGTPKVATGAPPFKNRVEKSKSVSQSPSTPSGRLSTNQSPAMSSSKRPPPGNAAVLAAAAEQMIDKARSAASAIAANPQVNQVEEYQKMISTGLACFEAALHGKQLTPRQEARVRLRYAAVLHEETDNIGEAETTLSKGITLCDKHLMHDLKYCMQYMMMQVLFRRNPKAGLKALDQHIADCETYKHVHWAYAFRLLKASFYEELGNAADASSFENMRALQTTAAARGDVAMSVYASLSEALIMLKTSKGSREAFHSCLAQASKHQFDDQAKMPQLELMALLLMAADGLHRESHDVLGKRLHVLKKRIGNLDGVSVNGGFLMPIKSSSSASQTISLETSAIIQPGDPEAPGDDLMVMKFMPQQEMAAIVFSLCGLNYLHKQHLAQHDTATLWQEGLKTMKHYSQEVATTPRGRTLPLKQAIEQRNQCMRTQIYLDMLLGLLAASHCKWDAVHEYIMAVEKASHDVGMEGSLKAYYCYLKGAYCQGTGELGTALKFFQDESLSLSKKQTASGAQQHLALLAGINRVWIMQRPEGAYDWPYENHALTQKLLEDLGPLCAEHDVQEIRVAWWVINCSAVQNPPLQRNVRKDFANRALHASRSSENNFGKLISIVGARELLYNNVLAEQAMKSIRVAIQFAKKSGSPLWQSVVAGIWADFSETKNDREEAHKNYEYAAKAARVAFQQDL